MSTYIHLPQEQLFKRLVVIVKQKEQEFVIAREMGPFTSQKVISNVNLL